MSHPITQAIDIYTYSGRPLDAIALYEEMGYSREDSIKLYQAGHSLLREKKGYFIKSFFCHLGKGLSLCWLFALLWGCSGLIWAWSLEGDYSSYFLKFFLVALLLLTLLGCAVRSKQLAGGFGLIFGGLTLWVGIIGSGIIGAVIKFFFN